MRSMLWVVRVGMGMVLSLSAAFGGVLSERKEARLHPAFRALLREASDSRAKVTGQQADALAERGAIIYTSDAASLRASGIKVQSVYDGFVTARVRPEELSALARMDAVQFIDLPKENYPQMDVSLGETGAPLLHAGFINNTPYKGEGTIVLIYDTGIDWRHLDFRDPEDTTKTRILAIWDQTITPVAGESSPAGFTYGVEYTKAQIEDEIDGSPTGFIREADTHGHGTHVAGTAAGNGLAVGGKYLGMAPLADIIVVKGGNGSFAEDRMIDGLTYAQRMSAVFGRPIVVNWSIGGQTGPHDGSLPYEVAVNSFVGTPGKVVCISAGNDGGATIHTEGSLESGSADTLRLVVPEYTAAAGTENDRFFLDVWFTTNPAVSVEVVSPTGIRYMRAAGQSGTGPNQSDGTIDLWNYVSSANGHRNVQVYVHDQTTVTPRPGTWLIILTAGQGTPVGFDAWLSVRTVGSAQVALTGGDTHKTLSMPGGSSGAITVGSYITKFSWPSFDGGQYNYTGTTDRVGNFSFFSGVGPTADGRQKPDIAAPGENIISSLSGAVNMSGKNWAISPDGTHQVMFGTSMAAPHVSGAAALLLGLDPGLTADQIKRLLVTTSDGDNFATGLPNVTWGFGKLDVVEALARALNGGATVSRSILAYDEPGTGFYWQLTGPARYAVRFSSSISGRFTGMRVAVYNQNVHAIAGNGALMCELYTASSGAPGTRIGNPVQIPFSQLSPGTANYLLLTGTNADVSAGTDYYAVLSLAQAGDTLAVLSDNAANGTRSMSFDGARWNAMSQNFRFRPIIVSTSGVSDAAVGGSGQGVPLTFELGQNFPNPFNPSTRIIYAIPARARVSLKVFDVLGKEVATIADGERNAGTHEVVWNGTNNAGHAVSSGVYFYRLESAGKMLARRMLMMK